MIVENVGSVTVRYTTGDVEVYDGKNLKMTFDNAHRVGEQTNPFITIVIPVGASDE